MGERNWFQGCETVAAVKALYRKLALQHHPDVGGDNETMKEINLAYHAVLARMDRQESFDEQGKVHTYYYNQKVEDALLAKMRQLLDLHMVGVTVELVGTWLWVSGETRPYKDVLKAKPFGMWWHSRRKMWYWRQSTYRREYSGLDMDTLRWMYGSRVAQDEDDGRENAGRGAEPAKALPQ